ncbi:MAG: hypothetical protein WCV84_02890 [Patescibacteria group bacterium]
MLHFLACGTHPSLSLAEAKAVLGLDPVFLVENIAVYDTENWDGSALMEQLGGTIKLGDVIADLPQKDMAADRLADMIDERPRANRVLYGLTIKGSERNKHKNLPIQLKKALKERGRSARWVTGDQGDLTPAAVAKCHLTDEGYDFTIALAKNRALVCLTTNVQDADAWSKRDFGRPFRDATTGMLPPKVARMMVNLAATHHTILDPFCGAGTVLMEAALLKTGKLIGSDLDTRQIEGARVNLDWLVQAGLIDEATRTNIDLHVQAAETIDKRLASSSIDAIVTEGFLGKPLQGDETVSWLKRQQHEIEELWIATLKASAKILKPSGRVICVWPTFIARDGSVSVDVSQELANLGYNKIGPTLEYGRPEQHVKRGIVVLEKL